LKGDIPVVRVDVWWIWYEGARRHGGKATYPHSIGIGSISPGNPSSWLAMLPRKINEKKNKTKDDLSIPPDYWPLVYRAWDLGIGEAIKKFMNFN
jgi:hypothetical protein